MKLAAWFLLAVSSASFAATMIVERAEERQRQVCLEMAKPVPSFLRAYETDYEDLAADSATAAIEYE